MSSGKALDPSHSGAQTVRDYLDCIVANDWDGVGRCLSDRIVRVGPFGDTYEGKEQYVGFLAQLMPTLEGYSMKVDRVLSGERFALAELSETVNLHGAPVVTPEALVFDLDERGVIEHIAIYIQRLGDGA